MRPHHQFAMERAVERLAKEPDLRLLLLGGSIAKGIERESSDVDMIAIVSDEGFAQRQAEGQLTFYFPDLADWDGGYVEGRFVSRTFALAAADRGSEPTRHSFTGVRVLWGDDAELIAALPRIPVYPEAERTRRLGAFFSQLALWQRYFWWEARRMEDPVLQARSASEVVLFGVRMLLAHNRVLFPCQKRLMETLAKCPEKPQGIELLAANLVTLKRDEDLEAFCAAVLSVTGVPEVDTLSAFTRDVESSWFAGSHAISEW